MKRKTWLLFFILVILVGAGGVFYFYTVVVLEIKNMDRPRMIQIRVSPPERFSIFYIHSIYRQPVIEEFQAEKDNILLKGVKTKSPAVAEYYGFEDSKEFHPLNRSLGTFFLIRRGMGEGQGVLIRGRKIYLNEIGERGDRLQLRLRLLSPGEYILGVLE